jgi:hypothetical protein
MKSAASAATPASASPASNPLSQATAKGPPPLSTNARIHLSFR